MKSTRRKKISQYVLNDGEKTPPERKCINGCCTIKTVEYKWDEEWYQEKRHKETEVLKTRVGFFIYDPVGKKVLMIQSCGYLWGLPKGKIEPGETLLQGALRELKEETGIVLQEKNIHSYPIHLKRNSYYFYYEMPECEVKVQTKKGNDANGIAWISLNCMDSFKSNDKRYLGCHMITKHCRQLLYKLFNVRTYQRKYKKPEEQDIRARPLQHICS